MDASRCIAYLTIEKGGPIPEELRAPIGRQVFGCDICQEVCPWNAMATAKAGPRESPGTPTRPELINAALTWLAGLSPEEFNRQFRGSPVKRTKRGGLLRNVAIAMGNSGNPQYLPQLESWADAETDDPVLAETARWAIRQLRSDVEPADSRFSATTLNVSDQRE
jgi:epoxyqueuosine reductase